MWENVTNCTHLIICLFRINYFANFSSQIHYLAIIDSLLSFDYFAKNRSQI